MNETNWVLGARDGLPASATPADTLWVQQARTDYLGGVTLEAMGGGPARLRLQVAGGFVTIEPAQQPRYHYYVGDHLGSVRLVVDEYGEVEQYNDFYAYGSQTSHGRGAGLQPYKFTGKELETTHGQCLYDFGARWLDPLLPRWTSTDPLAEAYYHVSPYAYCAGNPVSFVDPDGMGINDVNELEGATIVGERKKRYVMDKSWYEWKKNNQREQEQTSKISDDNEPGGSGPSNWRDKLKDAIEKAKKALSEMSTLSAAYGETKHYEKGDYREWTDSKGRKRTSKELEKQANGKYKKGVQGIRNSEKFAKAAAAPWKTAGQWLGGIIVGLDVLILIDDPSWENAGYVVVSAVCLRTCVGIGLLGGGINYMRNERKVPIGDSQRTRRKSPGGENY